MRLRNILDGCIPIIVFIVIWEGVARIHIVPEYIFPSFSAVMGEFYHLTVSGVLLDNLASSLFRVLAGFFLGSLAGIMMGIVMGCKGFINRSFHPIFSLLYPIPTLGWAPLRLFNFFWSSQKITETIMQETDIPNILPKQRKTIYKIRKLTQIPIKYR